jgi:uncharacterized protein with HEPN domain
MRREAAFLEDIVSAADELAAICAGQDRETFFTDSTRWRATLQLLTVIGEASPRLSDDFRRSHPQGSWGKAAGLRNIIVHEYWNLDWAILWATIQEDIPVLREVAANILKNAFPPEGS